MQWCFLVARVKHPPILETDILFYPLSSKSTQVVSLSFSRVFQHEGPPAQHLSADKGVEAVNIASYKLGAHSPGLLYFPSCWHYSMRCESIKGDFYPCGWMCNAE